MLSFKKIFPSLRSLWIILLSWRYLTPRRICFIKYLVSGSVMAFRLLCNSIRLRRRHNSKMMYTKSWKINIIFKVSNLMMVWRKKILKLFNKAYLVFKVGIQFYYIRMIQSFVKGYLLSHFLSLMLFDQEWFGNNFSSNHWWVLNCHISEFVTFCESSLKRKKGISAISLQLDLLNMFFKTFSSLHNEKWRYLSEEPTSLILFVSRPGLVFYHLWNLLLICCVGFWTHFEWIEF